MNKDQLFYDTAQCLSIRKLLAGGRILEERTASVNEAARELLVEHLSQTQCNVDVFNANKYGGEIQPLVTCYVGILEMEDCTTVYEISGNPEHMAKIVWLASVWGSALSSDNKTLMTAKELVRRHAEENVYIQSHLIIKRCAQFSKRHHYLRNMIMHHFDCPFPAQDEKLNICEIGSSLEEFWEVAKLKSEFPEHPWLDIASRLGIQVPVLHQ